MSVFLPKTTFNLYSNAKELEEKILNYWQEINLEKLRFEKNLLGKKFVLHDGPPYANGSLHIGHAENKFWKDCLNKIFWQNGYNVNYILGWDAHGLPIENAVEKKLKEEKINKNELTRSQFWDKCRDFATYWMNVQKEQFKKMAIFADYDNVYATFFESESIGIIECIHDFVEADLLEQRYKPVLWSYVEKTALAYAEVEYKEKSSNAIFVLFPVVKTNIDLLHDAFLIIWTTTPWTLPANETVAYNKDFTYCVIENTGKRYCLLENLIESSGLKDYKLLGTINGNDFCNTYVTHPIDVFATKKNKFVEKRLIHSNHVEDGKGSGFVHIAPSHGEDDFNLGIKYDLNIEDLLDDNGYFKKHVPLVGGFNVKEAEEIILSSLGDKCIKHEKTMHSYPHSWRSKAPLIFRLTKQWFLKMKPLQIKAMQAVEKENINWIPAEGKNRFQSMLMTREDWCISRQRIWGVPIAIFYNKQSNQVLNDKNFLQKTIEFLRTKGVKYWWNTKISDIDSTYQDEDWQRVDDIIDIWFESGATQYFVLQKNQNHPADIYLEGSDQHRGWFQSSLLISAFQTERAPWKNLITHGFCLDNNKQKMSKSLGNVVNPQEWPVDELRLFFASQNLCGDVSLNENNIKHAKEMLFRFKNTLKFILGMLAIEEDKQRLNTISLFFETKFCFDDFSLLEKWLLHKIAQVHKEYLAIFQSFQVNNFVNKLYEFCQIDLSSFYFDIRKDILYCERQNNEIRQSVICCLKILADILLFWLSSITPFLAQDAWDHYINENELQNYEKSIHLVNEIKFPLCYFENAFAFTELENIRNVRKIITEEIENMREKKILTISQEVVVCIDKSMINTILNESEFLQLLKEITIVSSINVGDSFSIVKHCGEKCTRCRFYYYDINSNLCARCTASTKYQLDF